MTTKTLLLALALYLLLRAKPSPRGDVDIGEPTIGSNPDKWKPYPGSPP